MMPVALPGVTRLAGSRDSRANRRCETTGPAFWLMPIWSRDSTSNPARMAAVASTWLTVTMPVPPMPAMNTLCVPTPWAGSPDAGPSGAGTAGGAGTSSRRGVRPSGASTVTNAGQLPSRQE